MRDWLLEIPNNKYYETEKVHDRTKSDDVVALALILLENSSLCELRPENKNPAGYENMLRKLTQRYSRGYILAIYVMLKKI